MGYHVAIIRTDGSAESILTEVEITKALDGDPAYSFDGVLLSRNGQPFLRFFEGELWLKNPSETELEEMIAIANKLGARVRGDEFETYSSVSESYAHADDRGLEEAARIETKRIKAATRKRQWLLNGSIMGFFVLLVIVFKKAGWLE